MQVYSDSFISQFKEYKEGTIASQNPVRQPILNGE